MGLGVGPQYLIDDHADVGDGDVAVAVGIGTVLGEASSVGQLQDAVHHYGNVGHGDAAVGVGVTTLDDAFDGQDVVRVDTHFRCLCLVGIQAVVENVNLATAGIIFERVPAVFSQLGSIDGDGGQAGAACEGCGVDTRHAGGNFDAFQTCAT